MMIEQRILRLLHKLHETFLGGAKRLGLFSLSEHYYRGHLPILCYHGFGTPEDSDFRDIFMTASGFERRLQWLDKNGFSVLPLERAVSLLKSNLLPPKSVVITIDDGFWSTYHVALPLLKRYNYPATIYITTYYVKHWQHPVFRLSIQFLFWKTCIKSYRQADFIPGGSELVSTRGGEGERGMWRLIQHGEQNLSEEQRFGLFLQLATALQVDVEGLLGRRTLHLLTPEMISSLAEIGFDIQLHTHRHQLPDTRDELHREVEENRRFLEPLVGKELHHFCYPSGYWTREQRDMLHSLDVHTATTCDDGPNSPQSHLLSLGRFCDSDRFSLLEFEAELRGFNQLSRLNPVQRAIRRVLRL